MHRVLWIKEVVYNICWFLGDQAGDKPDNVTLARLARTCRFFHDPALTHLYNCTSISQLIMRCLPKDLWMLKDQYVYFVRVPDAKDWEVLLKYGRYVQEIEWRDPAVDTDVYHILSCPPTGATLFPNLLYAWWGDVPQLARIVVGPKLVTLRLDLEAVQIGLAESSILISLASLCPAIEYLGILSTEPTFYLSQAISACVRIWTRVRAIVQCQLIDNAPLVHFALLPNLETMYITLPPSWEASVDPQQPFTYFPSLRELCVSAPLLTLVSALLDTIRARMLKLDVYLSLSGHPTVAYQRFFAVVGRSSESLACIAVRELESDAPHSPDFPRDFILTYNAFEPLLRFTSLSGLTIDSYVTFSLTDSDLTNMAKAWPNLVQLSLNKTWGWRKASEITFSGLIRLVECCPKLAQLCLAIDTSDVEDMDEERPGGGVSNERVRHLNLADSVIKPGSIINVASIISDIFPWVDEISAWDSKTMQSRPGAKEQANNWKAVHGLNRCLAQIRRQERSWEGKLEMDHSAPAFCICDTVPRMRPGRLRSVG
ncbi:hypothetical protein HYDPIDRAFT_165024 [Hydnomerulius pinastri MD-312]|nr:hypothetical protein HYDPIDRAFT_165024 [Hydnomerulius pinastri MD-312]